MDLRRVQSRRKGWLEEVEVGFVVGKGVRVPGQGVLDIEGVVPDIARDGVIICGQCTMHKASFFESSKM